MQALGNYPDENVWHCVLLVLSTGHCQSIIRARNLGFRIDILKFVK